MNELNNAKKEAERLAQKMRDQDDEDAVKEYADILRQIKMRRTPDVKKLAGHELEPSYLVDIDDVEDMAKDILAKNYTSTDILKQDNERLKKMVERYKKSDKDAERQLEELEFLFGRIDRKIAKATTKLD